MGTKNAHLEQPLAHPSPKKVNNRLDVRNIQLDKKEQGIPVQSKSNVSNTALNEEGGEERKIYHPVISKSYPSNKLKENTLKEPSGLVEESETKEDK